jgi:hypothetical protein
MNKSKMYNKAMKGSGQKYYQPSRPGFLKFREVNDRTWAGNGKKKKKDEA